ncbi:MULTISPECIES: GNAT family N-acetyltransferase [Pseudomonas]|jgi:phosphinothricin acetyltransferase|uniref:GNAT family N-acetyltransferase n=1 Tax=Pseudomonas TaxID=286 RepID=UPI000B06D178|nr:MULTISPECIES: GNAT family N-acetyltransferase [Pseudomonas]
MTVYVAEGQRRSRVGQQLYDVLLTVLKRSGYHCIALSNEGSVGLYERLGFQHIGTFP